MWMKRISALIIIIISSLSINLSHGSPNIRKGIARKRSDNLTYQLTENVFPEQYILKICPRFNNNTFKGYVKILIHIKIPTNNITLHQKNLTIIKENIFLTTNDDSIINITNAGNSGTKEQQFYTITFLEKLKEGTYYLHIPEFYGVLNDEHKGFYYAQYIDKNHQLRKFATTQFEASYARCAFPCFDEPPFKATFKIYLIRPKSYNSVSNTKLIQSIKLNNSLYEDEFDITVKMSTYLVAFIVSEMKLSPEGDQHFYRILTRPEFVEKNYEKYSLTLAQTVLHTLEIYFNVNYTLNKMYLVAIPDMYFNAGAMENWGLVTYKERNILLTPRTSTRQSITMDTMVTHEFVHHWFGNLVSVKWWRYLWLKEGFAEFLQSRIIAQIKPELRRMEEFNVIEKHGVLATDASAETRDMNQDVGSPTEIAALYDAISYQKAACVIHMLETVMTQTIFKRGLTNYLQDRGFRSATPTDLYRNLQKAVDSSGMKLPENLNIRNIMTTWDSQKGYPLVYVERNYFANETTVKLTQNRYVYTNVSRSKQKSWYIPINYATKSNPNFNDTQFSNWLLKSNKTITIKNLNRDDWLIVNKQEAYYYRVNYDTQNWKLISNVLLENHSDIHILNRAQIIDDSFDFANNLHLLDFSVPLRISRYLYKDDEYIIHYVFLKNMIYIEKILRGADVEQNFKNFVTQTLEQSYNRLGHIPRDSDTKIDKLHRKLVVRWMCNFNYLQCRKKTRMTYDLWRNNNVSLPVDLEAEILCNVVRIGSEADWRDIFRIYYSRSSDANLKKNAFQALGCTTNGYTLQTFFISSMSPPNTYTLSEVVSEVIKQGSPGSYFSIHFVAKHFGLLHSFLGDKDMLKVVRVVTSYITTETQLDDFIKEVKGNTTIDNVFMLAFETARLDVSRTRQHFDEISKFFTQNTFRSSGNLCNTIIVPNAFAIILFSLIVTILCL